MQLKIFMKYYKKWMNILENNKKMDKPAYPFTISTSSR